MARVLEVLGEPIRYGGQEAFLMNMYPYFTKDNVVDTVTMYDCVNEKFVALVESLGGSIFALGNRFEGRKRFLYGSSFARFLRGRSYDVVHVHSGSTLNLEKLSRLARAAFPDARIVVHSHSTAERMSGKQRLIRRLGSLGMKRSVDDYLACSQAAGLSRFDPALIPSFRVIDNGIDTLAYAFDPVARERIRELHGIAPDAVVVGNVGRLTVQKNQVRLLHVFEQFRADRPGAKLLLVGEGPIRDELDELAVALGIADDVVFAGTTTDVPAYLSAMDVFAFPSVYEGFGLAPLEAVASALPVVVSEVVAQNDLPGDLRVCSLSATDADWAACLARAFDEAPARVAAPVDLGSFESSWSGDILNDLYASN